MTRMWIGVDPRDMCDQHLLGEHSEIHQELGHLNAGNFGVVKGHVKRSQFFLSMVGDRHRRVVREMESRGMNHDSPLPDYELLEEVMRFERVVKRLVPFSVQLVANVFGLRERCGDCRERMDGGTQ